MLLISILASYGLMLLPLFVIIFTLNCIDIVTRITDIEIEKKQKIWLTTSVTLIVMVFAALLAAIVYK